MIPYRKEQIQAWTGELKRAGLHGHVGCDGRDTEQTGYQPGMVANPACDQLNREKNLVPVRA